MWLGMFSSAGKQRRLMGELHTRMSAGPANVGTDRTGLRTAYLPALRASLVRPLVTREQEGIPAVIATMQVGGGFRVVGFRGHGFRVCAPYVRQWHQLCPPTCPVGQSCAAEAKAPPSLPTCRCALFCCQRLICTLHPWVLYNKP